MFRMTVDNALLIPQPAYVCLSPSICWLYRASAFVFVFVCSEYALPSIVPHSKTICTLRSVSQALFRSAAVRTDRNSISAVIICPTAIAYSVEQIIKPVCLCPCVRLRALLPSHFLMDFQPKFLRSRGNRGLGTR